MCSVCNELGVGKRYACRLCVHQLHDFCTLAPQALTEHPFHNQRRLLFYSKPAKGAMAKYKCDACRNPSRDIISGGDRGFTCGECKKKPGQVYHWTVCKYRLHAVCAKCIFNGLSDCGIEEVDKRGRQAGSQALIIKDFVGGVVEGIGQGLGNDIVQKLVNGGGFKLVTLNDRTSHHRRS